MINKNRQICFRDYPNGLPDEHTFEMKQGDLPKLGDSEMLIRTLYISVDPYLRNRMNKDKQFYQPPFEPGQVLISSAIGQVVDSQHPDFSKGDLIEGMLEWQDYSLSNGFGLQKLDSKIEPLSHALGILGITGLTGYFGMVEVGKPQLGESIVVSGASGAVGTVAGQIAKIKGARVVGLAGSKEKGSYLVDELGFDKALNYKSPQFLEELKEACPGGPDLYFDNVGGTVSEVVMSNMKYPGRIVECGQVGSYNDKDGGWRMNIWPLHLNSLRLEAFVVYRFAEHFPEARNQMAQWLAQGKLKAVETITEGLENAPKAFADLFHSASLGKQLVRVNSAE